MRISEAESVVMEEFWKRGALYAEDVIAAVGPKQDWQDRTVKTLLGRLMNKGALEVEQHGRRYLYIPALKREDWVKQEGRNLFDRLFGGQLAPLVSHFSQHRKLSAQDIAELKKLIGEQEEGR
jgi:BlaI family penicillinase repressor